MSEVTKKMSELTKDQKLTVNDRYGKLKNKKSKRLIVAASNDYYKPPTKIISYFYDRNAVFE